MQSRPHDTINLTKLEYDLQELVARLNDAVARNQILARLTEDKQLITQSGVERLDHNKAKFLLGDNESKGLKDRQEKTTIYILSRLTENQANIAHLLAELHIGRLQLLNSHLVTANQREASYRQLERYLTSETGTQNMVAQGLTISGLLNEFGFQNNVKNLVDEIDLNEANLLLDTEPTIRGLPS